MDKYFTVEKQNNTKVITLLFSELSVDDADEFKSNLYTLISSSGNNFVVNMSKCDFLASIAIGIIVNFNVKVKEKGGKVVFCCLTQQAQTIFKITQIVKILTVRDTQEEALQVFTQQ